MSGWRGRLTLILAAAFRNSLSSHAERQSWLEMELSSMWSTMTLEATAAALFRRARTSVVSVGRRMRHHAHNIVLLAVCLALTACSTSPSAHGKRYDRR